MLLVIAESVAAEANPAGVKHQGLAILTVAPRQTYFRMFLRRLFCLLRCSGKIQGPSGWYPFPVAERNGERMLLARSSGILLHPTSLPGPYGAGDFGPETYQFLDFLHAAGQKLWQVLPINSVGYRDSPFQCFLRTPEIRCC